MSVYARNAFLYATIVAMGGLIFGLDAALISGTVRFVTSEFNLTDLQLGTVVGAPGFGVIFALLATGPICNAVGRKKTLLLISLLYLFSAVFSMLAPTYGTLVAARFIGGLAFTSLSLASMYTGEIAPANMRGKLVAMNQILIVVGLTAAYASNYYLIENLPSGAASMQVMGMDVSVWRLMLGVEIIPTIMWFLLVLLIPESPRWLLSVGREDEARAVMRKLMPEDEIEEQIANIEESASHTHVSDKNILGKVGELFESNMRKALFIGIAFAIVQPITGINAILFYAPMVFEQTGIGTNAAFAQTLIIGVVSLVFTGLAIALIDRLGRRPIVLIGLTWSVASLLLCFWAFDSAVYQLNENDLGALANLIPAESRLALSEMASSQFYSDIEFKQALSHAVGESLARQHESAFIQAAVDINVSAVLLGILGFIAAFHMSVGPVMWVVFSEIVPIHARGLAIPLFAFITSIFSVFVQKFFPWQLSNQGAANIFLFYAVAGFLGFIIMYVFLPETKNKTIEEIEALLSSDGSNSTEEEKKAGKVGEAHT